MAEQRAIEIQVIRRILAHRLRLAVGDVDHFQQRQVLRRNRVAVLAQAFRVVADHVLAHAERAAAGRDVDVVPRRPIHGFLAGEHWHPNRRMRALQRPRPDGDVVIAPELSLVREHLLGPGLDDDVVGFLESRARLRERRRMRAVLARNAAGEAGDDAAVRQAVQHRRFFGQPQRLMQRQQVAVDQQLQPLRALCRRGRHQVRRGHQPVGRGVVLVEADAVVAEAVQQFPRLQVLGVGARADLGLAVARRQRIRQFAADLQVLKVLAVGQQVEYEHLHLRLLRPPMLRWSRAGNEG
jgi:hypothetical protein